MAEPPYGEIADLLKRGEIVPFLGAGVNFGARPSNGHWDGQPAQFLPSGAELSRFLANRSSFPSTDEHDLGDLAKVASYFVETTARRRLRERLNEVFDHDFPPCSIHTYLAGIDCPLLVVTTNYDDLIERSFIQAGRPYDLVVHPTDRKDFEASVLWWKYNASEPTPVPPNQLYIDLTKTTVIYKMHGTVDRRLHKWGSYVITEDDYVDFLSRMTGQTAVPAVFMKHFRERHFLFLGYGLNDWNLRVVLRNLRVPLPKVEGEETDNEAEEDELISWAIQFRPSDLEKELWSARRVKIYDLDINEFVKGLRDRQPES